MKEYIRLVKFIRPHIWILVLAAFFMILSSVFGGISLWSIIPFVDKIISGKEIQLASGMPVPDFVRGLVSGINALPKQELLNYLLYWIMLIFLLKEVCLFCQEYFMAKVGQRVVRDIKDKIYHRLLDLSMDFYSKNTTGKLVSRITYDAALVRDSVTVGLTDLIYQPTQLFVYAATMIFIKMYFSISWLLIFLSIFLLPSIVYPVIRIGRHLRKISKESQEKMSDINTILYETISGISIVKAFSMEDYEKGRFQKQNKQFYRISMKSVARMLMINPLTEFAGLACAAMVIWFGGREVAEGRLSPGAFVAFMGALFSLFKPYKRLSRVYGVIQQALAAAFRIFEVLDTKTTIIQPPDAPGLKPIRERIDLENLWFKYDKENVLSGINLKIKKGEIVAFVGPSGSGKTTLVNLIPRFYDPQKGSVRIDGTDIKTVTLKSLRKQIGIVSQDTILFNDTVSANISYGHSESKENLDKIVEASKIANAHGFIERMPQRYDTIIGEKGFKLSGGEKQRLALARAIFKNPPILILDEATSQLDTESERLVQEAIDRLMENRTVLVIAHRLSTIKHADSIVVLERGSVVGLGTHEELMEEAGLYKKLYDMQFLDER
jgi:subfamily B ATP-binding cassette protein MsbA